MSAQVEPVYDAVLLTCKAYDLDAAVDAIAPAVTPTGFVLPLLNGIAHMESLNRRFGENRVLGGTAKIQASLTPGGAIRQFNDWCGPSPSANSPARCPIVWGDWRRYTPGRRV